MPRYIFISGGVISGLGKGITTASLALLLKSAGFKVTVAKLDMYLNQDAGTMNPLEHGEVFVTKDGKETDQDLGHYERFLGIELTEKNYLTAGQAYQELLDRERHLDYDGKCVQPYHHIPPIVINRWKKLGEENDFVLIELGGTVGEYEGMLFFEAARRLMVEMPDSVYFIHVVYLLTPRFLGEMKTKPAQQSIVELNKLGIRPHFIICRSEEKPDQVRLHKISLAAALDKKNIFSTPNVDSIYKVPLVLKNQNFIPRFLKRVGLSPRDLHLKRWQKEINKADEAKNKVTIGIAGKYYASGNFSLEDAYVSVVESVKIAAWHQNLKPNIVWIDTENIESNGFDDRFKNLDGLIVPGGFGSRGIDGKIKVIKWARENKIPFLGLCYGMQLAVVEFARNAAGLKKAHTTEVNPDSPHPVIHIMPDQEKEMLEKNYGATMRLGNWDCSLKNNTHAYDAYGQAIVKERHRHRYELNNDYREQLQQAGLILSGISPDDRLVEIIELPKTVHPFFVGTQFHPEFASQFMKPNPLFSALVSASKSNSRV
jgi:CTP synthase